MKKILFVALLLISIVSCSKKNDVTPNTKSNLVGTVDYNRAVAMYYKTDTKYLYPQFYLKFGVEYVGSGEIYYYVTNQQYDQSAYVYFMPGNYPDLNVKFNIDNELYAFPTLHKTDTAFIAVKIPAQVNNMAQVLAYSETIFVQSTGNPDLIVVPMDGGHAVGGTEPSNGSNGTNGGGTGNQWK